MSDRAQPKDPPAEDMPPVGSDRSGKRQQAEITERPTKPMAPEAKGGAGAGRKWPGDS